MINTIQQKYMYIYKIFVLINVNILLCIIIMFRQNKKQLCRVSKINLRILYGVKYVLCNMYNVYYIYINTRSDPINCRLHSFSKSIIGTLNNKINYFGK